jgi:hypothetical protein
MILLAAAVLAATSPPPNPPRRTSAAVAEARVSIRIISGVEIKLGAANNAGAPPVRDSVVHVADGSPAPAKLIEFQ